MNNEMRKNNTLAFLRTLFVLDCLIFIFSLNKEFNTISVLSIVFYFIFGFIIYLSEDNKLLIVFWGLIIWTIGGKNGD